MKEGGYITHCTQHTLEQPLTEEYYNGCDNVMIIIKSKEMLLGVISLYVISCNNKSPFFNTMRLITSHYKLPTISVFALESLPSTPFNCIK